MSKGYLNRSLRVTTGNLLQVIPELRGVIATIPPEGKTNREILHLALMKLGWTRADIRNLSKRRKKSGSKSKSSFKYYKPTGGAGNLGGGPEFHRT